MKALTTSNLVDTQFSSILSADAFIVEAAHLFFFVYRSRLNSWFSTLMAMFPLQLLLPFTIFIFLCTQERKICCIAALLLIKIICLPYLEVFLPKGRQDTKQVPLSMPELLLLYHYHFCGEMGYYRAGLEQCGCFLLCSLYYLLLMCCSLH